MVAANDIQLSWMREILIEVVADGEKNKPVKVRFDPPELIPATINGKLQIPLVTKFYLKSVYLCAPHLNYPSYEIACQHCYDSKSESNDDVDIGNPVSILLKL
jgi:hypothetical protein